MKIRSPIAACASAPIASPASSSVAIEVRPSRVAKRYRIAVVISAPTNAAIGKAPNGSTMPVPARMRSPSTMVEAAASAAPADTPTSPGSASGLRNRPCIMVPAAASIAPIMQAIAMRGRRIDHNTSRSRSISAGSPTVRPAAAISRGSGIPGGADGGGDRRRHDESDA